MTGHCVCWCELELHLVLAHRRLALVTIAHGLGLQRGLCHCRFRSLSDVRDMVGLQVKHVLMMPRRQILQLSLVRIHFYLACWRYGNSLIARSVLGQLALGLLLKFHTVVILLQVRLICVYRDSILWRAYLLLRLFQVNAGPCDTGCQSLLPYKLRRRVNSLLETNQGLTARSCISQQVVNVQIRLLGRSAQFRLIDFGHVGVQLFQLIQAIACLW